MVFGEMVFGDDLVRWSCGRATRAQRVSLGPPSIPFDSLTESCEMVFGNGLLRGSGWESIGTNGFFRSSFGSYRFFTVVYEKEHPSMGLGRIFFWVSFQFIRWGSLVSIGIFFRVTICTSAQRDLDQVYGAGA